MSLSNKVTFEQRLEGDEGFAVWAWGGGQGRGYREGQCQGSKTGPRLAGKEGARPGRREPHRGGGGLAGEEGAPPGRLARPGPAHARQRQGRQGERRHGNGLAHGAVGHQKALAPSATGAAARRQ